MNMRDENIQRFKEGALDSDIDDFESRNSIDMDRGCIEHLVSSLASRGWRRADIITFCRYSEHVEPTNSHFTEEYACSKMAAIAKKYKA